MDLAACSGAEAVNHSAWQHLHFPREPGESRGSIPCPRLQGKPRASSLEKPAQPHGSAHQAGERELCRNCAGRMQEGCRKDAGNTPHSLTHFLTISSLSITFSFLAGGNEACVEALGRAQPSSCSSLLLWLCRAGSGCCTRLPSSSGFSLAFPKEPREQQGLNAAWPRQSTAMAGTKQNQHSRAVIEIPSSCSLPALSGLPSFAVLSHFQGCFPGC